MLEHINVIVSAMIAVKHYGGLHIIVNAAPADLTRRLVVIGELTQQPQKKVGYR